jgi:hypothetical protein
MLLSQFVRSAAPCLSARRAAYRKRRLRACRAYTIRSEWVDRAVRRSCMQRPGVKVCRFDVRHAVLPILQARGSMQFFQHAVFALYARTYVCTLVDLHGKLVVHAARLILNVVICSCSERYHWLVRMFASANRLQVPPAALRRNKEAISMGSAASIGPHIFGAPAPCPSLLL